MSATASIPIIRPDDYSATTHPGDLLGGRCCEYLPEDGRLDRIVKLGVSVGRSGRPADLFYDNRFVRRRFPQAA